MTTSTTIPGPRGLAPLGPAGSMLRFFRDPIGCMRKLHGEYGSIAAVTRGDPSLVCAFGPELNREVLSQPDVFENAADFPIRISPGTALHRLTTFLVGMNGEEHRQLRRAMLQLFHKSHLEHYRAGVIEATDWHLSTWRTGQQLDLSNMTAQIALTVAFRCLFGMDVRSEAASLAKMALGFTSGATSLANVLVPLSMPGLPYRRFIRLCEDLESWLLALIRERRAEGKQGYDVLSVLLRLRDEENRLLPETLLVGLANELFIAGHETTARSLSWTLFLLDRHPEVLEPLLDELSSVLGGDPPSLEQLDQLPRLDAVIKESMRILPATPFLFFRKAPKGGSLSGHELPPGAKVIISPLITHHMPELFPEPRRFRPERWGGRQPSTYEYLPFGAGPRMCLGSGFASMTLRVILSMILQRHRLNLAPGARVSFKMRGVILGTKSGMPVRIGGRRGADGARPLGLPDGNLHELIDLP